MSGPVDVRLDPERGDPLYRQIVDQVVARIRSGRLPAGYRLPASRAWATTLGTHRSTIVRAYEELCAGGHAMSVVGRGTFILEQSVDEPAPAASSRPRLPWASLLAARLEAEPMRRVRRLDRGPGRPDTVDLAGLQPPQELLPHELLRRCLDQVLRKSGPEVLGYAPAEGVGRLRAAVARELTRSGIAASADDVLITTGSQQGLDLLARVLVDPGDTVLLEELTYTGALHLFAAAGAHLVGVPSDPEGPDPQALRRHGRAAPRLLYLIPNFRNPTGTSISRRRREEILAWSHEAGVPIIEDDYDADLALDDQPVPRAMRALDPDVVHVGTFSKKLIPALRVGYMLCPEPLRSRVVSLKKAQDLGTSALLQHALAEFLERGYLRSHLRRIRLEYSARRTALEEALAAHLPPALTWDHVERGLFVWVGLPPSLPSERVYEEARRRGVLVSPGLLNRASDGAPDGIRLTFCRERPKRLVQGAERLGEAINALLSRGGPSSAPRLDGI